MVFWDGLLNRTECRKRVKQRNKRIWSERKREILANIRERTVGLEYRKRNFNCQFNSASKLITAGIVILTKQIKLYSQYRMIEKWKKIAAVEKRIWLCRCITLKNCKKDSVDLCIVVAIAMTVECKQYRTGKYQCTIYVVLLKSNYKVLHEKGRKWGIKRLDGLLLLEFWRQLRRCVSIKRSIHSCISTQSVNWSKREDSHRSIIWLPLVLDSSIEQQYRGAKSRKNGRCCSCLRRWSR